MTKVQLLDVVKAQPFRAFEIHLDNGALIRVTHPDCVLITPGGETAVVAEGEHLRIMGIDHISQLVHPNK